MENLVGGTFFSLLIVGVGCLIYGGTQQKGSSRTINYVVGGLIVEGVAFLLFGLLSSYFIYTSLRPQVDGEIISLKQSSGKYPGSDFIVHTDRGESFPIHCRYNGKALQTGERISVRYLKYNHSLISAKIFTGMAAGGHWTESEGYGWGTGFDVFGAFCIFVAFRERKRMQSLR